MSFKSTVASIYNALGNTKAQRFRRAFLVLLVIAIVTMYGFNKEAIDISLGFGAGK
jgi:hypothetical protein